MPIYNVTVDDSSPMFVFSQGWGDSTSDPTYMEYFDQTFHATSVFGANATFTFNGSAVWLGGAKRINHDDYSVTLDGQTSTLDGFNTVNAFQQTLFSQPNLSFEQHTILLANMPRDIINAPWVDVDYITFTSGDGNNSTTSVDSTIDDGDSAVAYSFGWSANAGSQSILYHNGTLHSTSTPGANMEIHFVGSAIAVYGTTNVNHGMFNVSLDGAESVTLSGVAPTLRAQSLLYYASNLSNSSHIFSLSKADQNTNASVDFDYAVVSQYFASLHDSRLRKPGNMKAIIWGSIGGVLGLAVLVVGIFLARRYRRAAYPKNPVPSRRKSAATDIIPYEVQVAPDGFRTAPWNVPSPSSSDTGAAMLPFMGTIPYALPQRKARLPEANEPLNDGALNPSQSRSEESQMISSSGHTPPDAGPEVDHYSHPPPQYAQVFNRPDVAPERTRTPHQPEPHQPTLRTDRSMRSRRLPSLPRDAQR